ncbi:MAG: NAD-binding protein [Acutalibacter sp.]|nr:NAD-binding protein [Acutalibacter sp.]
MRDSIYKYFQVGAIQWMSHPHREVLRSLHSLLSDDYFDAIEVCHFQEAAVRDQAKKMLEQSGARVCYGAQPILLGNQLNPNALQEEERLKAEHALLEALEEAQYLDAESMAFLAGAWNPGTREEAYRQLLKTTRALCQTAGKKDMMIELEVFDYDMDKSALIGPAPLAARFAGDVRQTNSNFGLLADLSHFPTTYETSWDVVRTLRPYITHLHFGNAVVQSGKAGYDLTVTNRSPTVAQKLAAAGTKTASHQEIGETCGLVLTMLPNGPQAKEVMLGEKGVSAFMKPGSVLIDMSSINPVDTREIGAELAKKGVGMLDAPVSGGEPKAVDGTLSFMVGGDPELFRRFRPVLAAMGSSVVRCGEIGAGNTAKLVNQIIVACNIQGAAEAFILERMAGADPQLVFQAIRGGLAGSAVLEAKLPMMLEGNETPELHLKDLDNVLDCARSIGAPVPMTEHARDVLRWVLDQGDGQKDHSAMVRYYESHCSAGEVFL